MQFPFGAFTVVLTPPYQAAVGLVQEFATSTTPQLHLYFPFSECHVSESTRVEQLSPASGLPSEKDCETQEGRGGQERVTCDLLSHAVMHFCICKGTDSLEKGLAIYEVFLMDKHVGGIVSGEWWGLLPSGPLGSCHRHAPLRTGGWVSAG